jgi:hypothetical protein
MNPNTKDMNGDSQRLANQFGQSLESWGGVAALTINDATFLKTPISDLISLTYSPRTPLRTNRYETRKEEWAQIVYLSRAFLNTCLVQELTRLVEPPGGFDFLLDSLDSPIEALMLMSLIICARENHVGVSVVWKHPSPKLQYEEEIDFTLGSKRLTLEIRPQSYVGEHRVDFLLSYFGIDFVQSRSPDGVATEDWKEVRIDKKMVVECDGHDFHEKTKEQARRDKERDRNLQSLGYPVYRYTGSEIYADVFKGGSEVIRVFTGKDFRKDIVPG